MVFSSVSTCLLPNIITLQTKYSLDLKQVKVCGFIRSGVGFLAIF